jgi:hydroxyethylthiazole kinase-like sugar kinase family protein
MSNLAAIGLILATLCVAFLVVFYASSAINKHVDVIVTGVVDGVPASTKHCYLKLNQMFLTQTSGVIALSVVVAACYVGIADNVTDPGVTRLAYLAAGLAAFSAITWLGGGISFYIQCIEAIRQRER